MQYAHVSGMTVKNPVKHLRVRYQGSKQVLSCCCPTVLLNRGQGAVHPHVGFGRLDTPRGKLGLTTQNR